MQQPYYAPAQQPFYPPASYQLMNSGSRRGRAGGQEKVARHISSNARLVERGIQRHNKKDGCCRKLCHIGC